MKFNPDIHHRQSIRLKDHDYAKGGAYYITLCVQYRECVLGEIVDDKIELSEIGSVVEKNWCWLAEQYDYVMLDEFIVMPNHLHGIIMIDDGRGASRSAPTTKRKPLGRLIGAFKTISTKHVNAMRRTPEQTLWQRNFYEHIIRHDEDLNRIRKYIVENPLKWALDEENPQYKNL